MNFVIFCFAQFKTYKVTELTHVVQSVLREAENPMGLFEATTLIMLKFHLIKFYFFQNNCLGDFLWNGFSYPLLDPLHMFYWTLPGE